MRTAGMKAELLLSLFVTFAVAGCASSKAERSNAVKTNEILGAIQGRATGLTIGGVGVNELPENFDLNPELKREKEARAKTGIPLLKKGVAVLVSQRPMGADDVLVHVTPFIDRNRRAGLFVGLDVRDSQEWRVPKYHEEKMIMTQRRGKLSIVVVSAEGHLVTDVASSWSLFLAIRGSDGIICWSETSNDNVIAPRKSGFRRFRIEGTTDTEGWQLLKPLLPK